MSSTDDALVRAHAAALPLMDEVAPYLPELTAHLAGMALVAQTASAPVNRKNMSDTYQGMKRCIEVLIKVSTTYHAIAGELVGGEEVPESEAQLE